MTRVNSANNNNTDLLRNTVRANMIPNITLTLVLALLEITPYLFRHFSNSIHLLLIPLWIVSTALVRKGKMPIDKSKVLFWTVLWCSIQIIWRILRISDLDWVSYLLKSFIYIVPFMMIYVLNHYTEREKLILKNGLFVIIIGNVISNIVLFLSNSNYFYQPNMQRSIGWMTNAGDTSFVGMCMFIVGIFIIEIINPGKTVKKVLPILSAIICTYHIVFQNNRGTAFITLILLVCLIFLVSFRESASNKTLRTTIRIAFFAAIVFAVSVPVLSFLSVNLNFLGLGDKLQLVSTLAQGNSYVLEGGISSFSQRFLLMEAGISTVFSNIWNFLFGIGESTYGNYGFNALVNMGVSNHSEIIDGFTFYGVIGGSIKTCFIVVMLKECVKQASTDRTRRQVIAFTVIVFLYSVLNHILESSIMFVLFLYFPLVINLLRDNDNVERTLV